MYKAEDLQYDRYANEWDLDKENEKWTPPPLKRHTNRLAASAAASSAPPEARRRPAKFVAIKKIFVTSSPLRILNALELLNDRRSSPSV